MESINNDVAFVINVHERLVRDFPDTPYILWCRQVHRLSVDPQTKMDYILQWKLKPTEYSNPTLFRYDWQAFKLLSKFSPGGIPSELDKQVAYRKFRTSEERCAVLNEQWADSIPPRTAVLLHSVKNIIASVIGTVEEFSTFLSTSSYPEISPYVDQFSDKHGPGPSGYLITEKLQVPTFGPGVSVGRGDDKLSSYSEKIIVGTCTPLAADVVDSVKQVWKGIFLDDAPHGVRGSRLTFVPKRVGEARTICYEPSMNMWVQKQIGQYFKDRLKVALGIDLSNQLRNRSLAELGSLCDSYSTVDLSSASDLNSYMLVLNSLPFEWFNLLDKVRCHEYFDPIENSWNSFQKFSTMGNGFTFELETLLFAAIVKSAIDLSQKESISWREISVYGDDLIFPKEYYVCVTQALLQVGHIPNLEKSYSSGPFRESCGGDFFNGYDVTPFKIKELHLSEPKTVVNLFNGLLISSWKITRGFPTDTRFSRALGFIKQWLLRNYPRISEGLVEHGKYCSTMRKYDLQPSNRWLWSTQPTINVGFSRGLQSLLPKYLLEEYNKPRRLGDKVLYYEIHPNLVLFQMYRGVGSRTLDERTWRFKRNVCLFGNRSKQFLKREEKSEGFNPSVSPTH